jgi:hypothetical protein
MFTDLTIGFLVGVSLAAWVYTKLMRSSGGNTKSAAVAAFITGLLALIIVTAVLGLVFK